MSPAVTTDQASFWPQGLAKGDQTGKRRSFFNLEKCLHSPNARAGKVS